MTAIVAHKLIDMSGDTPKDIVKIYADGNRTMGNVIVNNNIQKIDHIGDFFVACQGTVAISIAFKMHFKKLIKERKSNIDNEATRDKAVYDAVTLSIQKVSDNKLFSKDRGVYKEEDLQVNAIIVHIPSCTIYNCNDACIDKTNNAHLGLAEFDILSREVSIDFLIELYKKTYPAIGGQWTVASTDTGLIEPYNPSSSIH